MPQQTLSTELRLDALLSSGFEDAFSSASDLMQDLKKESADLRKQLMSIGKEADEIEKVGKSAEHLRTDMRLLERQINETNRATERFGEARSHFRKASIGARAFKSDLAGILNTARNAALAIAGIGTAAAVALRPNEELLAFDQTLAGIGQISPEIDTSDLELARSQIRELSNQYGVSAAEIALQHLQMTRNLGFEGARETITAAVAFETATGLSITDFEEELATARISLGIDTPAETQQFLELLQQAHQQGIKIDNLDLGDLETLVQRTGEDVFGQNFQREFLTTIAFRQVDSFQFADYAQAFQEDLSRSVVITPSMEIKELAKVQENLKLLERHAIRAEDGILGAMQIFQDLTVEQRAVFREDLAPILGEMTVEVIARGSEALPRITEQVDNILASEQSLQDAAQGIASTWSGVWGRIGVVGQNSLGILRKRFAEVFGPPILALADRFFNFIDSHQEQISNFFTGVRDSISPVISKIWVSIRDAYPDIRKFALEVWGELKRQWQAIAPAAQMIGEMIWGIAKAVGGFLKEHPRLVATVISGVAAWKAYSLASQGISVVGDVIRGTTALAQGHIHRLNAIILENARLQGTLQTASLSVGKVFGGIGRAALGAIPGIGAMGGSLMTAIVPALPVMLPVIAAAAGIAGMGVIIYRNWDAISAWFSRNFETIRSALLLLFPPLGLLVSFSNIIKDNWEGIKDFFSTLWETVNLAFQVAFEGIQFIALSALVGIRDAWSSITGFFGELWSGIHGFFLDTPLAPVFEWMVDRVKAVVGPLLGFFDNFWQNVSDMAGEALGWVTGLLDGVNEFLGRWSDKFREENVRLREDLNMSSHVRENVLVDVKRSSQAEKPIIESAPLEVDKPVIEPLKAQIEKPSKTVMEKPGVPSVSELEAIIKSTEAEKPASTAPIVPSSEARPHLSTPMSSESPGVSMPMSDLIKVELGVLAEARKQTQLLENFKQTEMQQPAVKVFGETRAIESQVGTALPTIETPVIKAETPIVQIASPEMPLMEMAVVEEPAVEMPAIKVLGEKETIESQFGTALPIIETPVIEAPVLQIADAPAIEVPELIIETPAMEIEDYIMPLEAPEREAQSDVQSVEQEGTTAPVIVEQHNHFTIVQQPDEDEEALARRIADILDEQRDTLYVQ